MSSSGTAERRIGEKVDVPLADDAAIADLVSQFEACTWPYEQSSFCAPTDRRPLREVVDELVRQCSVEWIYEYYSKELVWSPAARANWVEPDRKPLDF